MWPRLSCVMNQLINTGIALNLLAYFRPFCEVLRVARALSNEKIFFILSSCKQDQYYNNSQLRLLIEQYVLFKEISVAMLLTAIICVCLLNFFIISLLL